MRFGVAADGSSSTDEDSLSKAMRRKAEANLDSPGITECKKSFLSFSNTYISAKLNSVGVSLGSTEKDIVLSTSALKHMEFDRLKVNPKVSSRSEITFVDDDEELNADIDGQLLSHLVGVVSEVDLDETVLDLKASCRKSKTSSARKNARPSKKAKCSKSPIVSK
jgi:hypothetical protein